MTQLFRHIANLGLLLSFTTLAVTGVMSFVLPFSITTTRVHIVFGVVTIVLVGMHLATRVNYFMRIAKQSFQIKAKKKPQVPRWLVGVILLVWAGLLYVSFAGRQPASALIGQGYEARHKAEIFRAAPQTVYKKVGRENHIVSRSSETGEVVIEVLITYREGLGQQPAAAVWAQTNRPHMIQTLFVDETLAYSDTPQWGGGQVRRVEVLPIWRNLYTQVNGVDPNGDPNAVTGATPKHSFSIEKTIKSEDGLFEVCLEINLPGDTNGEYTDPQLGQPSMFYATDAIDLSAGYSYYLMRRIGHGGGAEQSGLPALGVEGLTTAQGLVERVLVRIKRPGEG